MRFTPDQIRELAAQFDGREPRDILQWTADNFAPRAAISTAFGPEGLVILDLALRKVTPRLPVFTIDTGFLFPETHALMATIEKEYGIRIERLHPAQSPAEQAAAHGPELFRRAPDRCCYLRKVLPLQQKLPALDALVTGLRRSQSGSRQDVNVFQLEETPTGHRYVKISPLAAWSRDQVWDYIRSHQLPSNPLHDRGYASIGCTPDCCTRHVQPGDTERAGRWAGTDKKECGLHTFTAKI
jgi:phosphoadenosine phosphosulfate reductase